MNPPLPATSPDASAEISALIEVLHATDRRLEELLGGEVDAVMHDGEAILLRRAQSHLRESENARQAAILNALPANIALLDTRGVIVSVNEAWRQFADANAFRAPGHGVGVNYLDVCDRALGRDTAVATEVGAGIHSVLSGGVDSFSTEYRCDSPTQQRWFLLTVTPLPGDPPKGAVVMHLNITERKKAAQALEALAQRTELRERMLNTMLSSIDDFTYIYDRGGRFLFANQALLDLWGLTLEDVVGKNFLELGYPAALAEKLERQVRKVFETKGSVADETAYVSPTGVEGYYEYIFSPAFAADGSVEFVVGSTRDITQRRHAERRVRDSEKRFKAIFDQAPIAMALLDMEGHPVISNAHLSQMVGYSNNELSKMKFDDFTYPEDIETDRNQFTKLKEGKIPAYGMEKRFVHKSGNLIWANLLVTLLRDENGVPQEIIGMAEDITERKRVETALRDSEEEFRALASAMPQMVWMASPDGGNIYINEQWVKYTGLTLEESLGSGWIKPFHRDDTAMALDAWAQATKSGGVFSIECRLQRANGEYRWWLVRGVPALDSAGVLTKWIGTCTDIDELKRAEFETVRANQELKRQQAELRVLFDLMPAMVWFKDTENNILRVNQRVAQAAGLQVAQIEGRRSDEIYPLEAARYYADDLEVIRSGVPKMGIIETVRSPEGGEIWVRTDKVPYRDESGKVIGIVVVAQDITELKRDQEALRELNADLEIRVRARTAELDLARDEAEKANLAKSAFLATMSHEIRTPMNGVIGMIEVLQQTSLQAHQVEMIDLIRDSAFSLLQIIEDILDFSRIEAGKLVVDSEPMELAATVENVCGMLDHLAVKRGVRMTVFVDPSIARTVMGDKARLRQVLVNLAGNAIKFSGGREKPGHVSVRVVLVEREAQVLTVDMIVADDGIGIEEAALGRLFTPFSQADASTTRRFGGSGLGLAISGMLVQLMGGSISVRSVLGQGSTFTVRLRLTAVEGTAAAVDPSVQGLHCRIVGRAMELAEDFEAYLKSAKAIVERSPDLASAAAAARVPGLEIWLILPGPTAPTLSELRATAPTRPGVETRFVVLGWGGRRRPLVEAIDLVIVDADTMSRRTLLQVLALAAGRLKEEGPKLVAPATIQQQPPSHEEARSRGRLILIAEDNETNRLVSLRQLALIGFTAEVAVDGRDALERWRTGDFALVLTDLHMPEMDGYELTRAIRAEERTGHRTPIIALTANALRDEERRCLAAGMDAYLSKPVRLAQLKASIEAWIGPVEDRAESPKGRSPPVAPTPPADLAVLRALVGDDPVVIEEVLQSFRESAALSREELTHGIQAGAGPSVAGAAHKLKSAALSIGALRVGALCAEIELAVGAGRTSELARLLPAFKGELDAVIRFLDAR
ncbi:MAG: PAS domain S-box protein [Usitatibacter sp.]